MADDNAGVCVGALNAGDIGTEIAVVHKGHLYVGALRAVEHKASWLEDKPPSTTIQLVGDGGWRWLGSVPSTDVLQPVPPAARAEVEEMAE